MASRLRRIAGLSVIAWISMLGVIAVNAGVKWNQPGFRDPDIVSPFEMAYLFMFVLAIPFALATATLLAPSAIAADAWLRGRLTLGGNLFVGACLGLPTFAGFFGVGWLLFGRNRSLVGGMLRDPSTTIAFLIAFAVGGVVISLGMRRSSD